MSPTPTTLAQASRKMRQLVDSLPEGEFKTECNRQVAAFADRMRALPKRIANRGPFENAEQAKAVMTEECLWAVVPLDKLDLLTRA